ncbi:MAG: tetratricopeptide repeat protein [Planctomycetes bacterium]|nr:tetratricopeptide repeat protein [Planctomycetota bacterium]
MNGLKAQYRLARYANCTAPWFQPGARCGGSGLVVRRAWWVALLLILALAGCGPRGPRTTATRGGAAPVVQSQQNHLQIALDYVSRIEEFEPQQGMMQVAYQLNRWMESEPENEPWEETPLLAKMPETLRRLPPLADLDKREFTIDDVLYIRETSWMRSISQWVTEEEDPVLSEDWLKTVEQARGEPHAHDLSVATQLFDWTIRNIQLDPLLEYPTASDAAEGADSKLLPLYRGEPGPGYRTWPWQTLIFGRGDAWQRARVFARLARQQEIDVVMLAIDDASPYGRPRPWLPAALIDDQLYLFDTQLGLPIPGPDGEGVATLQQVRDDAQLLRNLDLGETLVYPVKAEDLDKLVVLLDDAPESLSYRMRLIDAHPTSSQQLTLSVQPSRLVQRLKACGMDRVQLWQIPLETWIFRKALDRRAEDDTDLIRFLFFEEWIFNGDSPLARARQQHFRGNFERQDDRDGAKALYLNARVTNTKIAQISTSPEIQRDLGIVRGRENDQQWEVRLQSSERMVVRIKQNASLWLGLIHYSTGRYEDARDWFQIRCLEAHDDGPWTASARYNLARTYEKLGDFEAARQLYLRDDSPQKHGNLLRARALRQRILEAAESNAKPVSDEK